MNIGIIGTGNMGKVLIESFIESQAVPPDRLTIMNRTLAKAEDIKKVYKEVVVVSCPEEVATRSDYIFICVKPLEIHPLLTRLADQLTEDKCIISITSPICVTQLETLVSCQVARIIPSITNRALSGISLFTVGQSCKPETREQLELLFSRISAPVYIDESVTRVSSDIVSCGPAFFSYLLQRFIDAAVKETGIDKEQATVLASGMIIGMGKLLEKELYTLPTLQDKVCVKGGVTGEGIKAMEARLGETFEELFRRTHSKFDEDKELISDQFHN